MTDQHDAGRAPVRTDGSAPLQDYLAIGDGRSVALVALDGSIDWWALPDLDSPPLFAALLDPSGGGRVLLTPVEPCTAEQRYVGDSNVVETVFTTASGQVRLTDALNTGVAGRLPWNELARRVEGLRGEVAMRWEVAPGSVLGTRSPWATDTDRGPVLQVGDLMLGVRCGDVGTPDVGARSVSGAFTTSPGSRGVLGVSSTAREPLHLSEPADVDGRIDRTVGAWQDWSDQLCWDGPHRAAVLRSALSLKLLLHSPTGSIAAAATTSLPEGIGGAKNWDYRCTWVRDTAYTLDAFVRLQLHEEVHGAVAWLLATVHREGLRPFYRLDGGLPSGTTVRDVPGYRGSRPVRDGNDAAGQVQLGPYGDLFQTVTLCVRETHVLDTATRRLLTDLADRCCDAWQRPDAGMWELEDEQHYTISKISCWQALDRAAALVDLGQLPGDGGRWRREADRVRAWVDEHCWSERRSAYVLHPGSDDLDAGVLLGARFGFDRGERMSRTTTAVLDELGAGPWLYRRTGMAKEEAAFVACTFWAVEALAFTDRGPEAVRLFEAALDALDGRPLLAEMIDPDTGDAVGNLPQALSHLALINAASALSETGAWKQR